MIRILHGIAQAAGGSAVLFGNLTYLVNIPFGADHAEPDSHIENAIHFFEGDIAKLLDEAEDGLGLGQRPKSKPDFRLYSGKVE